MYKQEGLVELEHQNILQWFQIKLKGGSDLRGDGRNDLEEKE